MSKPTFVIRWFGWSALVAAGVLACGGPNRGERDLVVTSFSPAEGDPGTGPIQIQFDRPVVDASQVGAALTEPPVDLEPAATVRAHWSDRQTLVLAPQSALAPSTRYTVKLREPLRARTGGFTFSFVHQPLQVQGLFGVDVSRLPPRPELPLQFNQPVELTDVVEHCAVQPAAGGDKIALQLRDAGAAAAAKVTVAPAAPLEQGKLYTLVCDGLAGAGGNAGLAEPWIAELRTYPTFSVTGVAPRGYDVPADEVEVEIVFANPVNLDEVRRAISIKPTGAGPAVAGFDLGALDQSGTRYKVVTDLATETEYVVRVRKGLRDIYSQALDDDYTHEFRSGDARPRLTV